MFKDLVLDPLVNVIEKYNSEHCFCINENFYTYRQFAERISIIRKSLQENNIHHQIVGIVTNDDIETYSSIFALWFEGCAYVPLSPGQPKERNLEIINQADIKLVLDSSKESLFDDLVTIQTNNPERHETDLTPIDTDDNMLAYILFTSGSTGKPKGVPITRGNLGAFMKAFWDVGFSIDNKDRCLQCFDLTFDVSVQSFLVPLTRGACAYTIPHNQIKYSYVIGLLEDHKLTFGALASSMIRFLQPYFDEIDLPDMRYNIVTAEASPVDLLDKWSRCIPNAEIYNFYGPTEATIYCTYYKFCREGRNKQLNGILSIGKPMKGIKAVIIDEENRVLETNQKGELCISGEQVSPGYWNNEERNNISFIKLSLDGLKMRFYKTGDICCKDREGDILYSGRLDFQVKIQGYRIELGEIEYYTRSVLSGRNSVAVAFQNRTGNYEIALFIEDEPAESENIIEALRSKIPHYMIPSRVIFIKQFPLNPNGKTDRNELKKIVQP